VALSAVSPPICVAFKFSFLICYESHSTFSAAGEDFALFLTTKFILVKTGKKMKIFHLGFLCHFEK
jgi:hypothetical protein